VGEKECGSGKGSKGGGQEAGEEGREEERKRGGKPGAEGPARAWEEATPSFWLRAFTARTAWSKTAWCTSPFKASPSTASLSEHSVTLTLPPALLRHASSAPAGFAVEALCELPCSVGGA